MSSFDSPAGFLQEALSAVTGVCVPIPFPAQLLNGLLLCQNQLSWEPLRLRQTSPAAPEPSLGDLGAVILITHEIRLHEDKGIWGRFTGGNRQKTSHARQNKGGGYCKAMTQL